MAVKTNLKDIGWMYHSPAAPRSGKGEIAIPPTSQIPGIGNMPDSMVPDPDPPRGLIKDTDTPYIIMAKQGGRRDLLNFRENSGTRQEPRGYPRCEWFYQDDILAEEAEVNKDREPWQFRLPDYMVHQAYNGGPYPDQYQSRLPFATDMDLRPTDKTVRLPELRKPGVGVRLAKARVKKPVKYEPIAVPQPFKRLPENEAARPKLFDTFDDPNMEMNNPSMHKILSMGYQRDWCNARDRFETDQREAARQQLERLARNAELARQQHASPRSEQQQLKQQTQQHYSHLQTNNAPWRPAGKPDKKFAL